MKDKVLMCGLKNSFQPECSPQLLHNIAFYSWQNYNKNNNKNTPFSPPPPIKNTDRKLTYSSTEFKFSASDLNLGSWAFRLGNSFQSALVLLVNYFVSGTAKRKISMLTSLNLSAVFDTEGQNMPLTCLGDWQK